MPICYTRDIKNGKHRTEPPDKPNFPYKTKACVLSLIPGCKSFPLITAGRGKDLAFRINLAHHRAPVTLYPMTNKPPYTIRRASWSADEARLKQVRHRVFVLEQSVPEALEWDRIDPVCQHWIAEAPDGTPLGTARLLENGQIGRMAVLPEWRGQGVGRALLKQVIEAAAERGHKAVFLHAQLSAEAFYLKAGFTPEGQVFEEAGIPHRTLRMTVH